jgi:hypothetical protein
MLQVSQQNHFIQLIYANKIFLKGRMSWECGSSCRVLVQHSIHSEFVFVWEQVDEAELLHNPKELLPRKI